jgi:hypothetical protein
MHNVFFITNVFLKIVMYSSMYVQGDMKIFSPFSTF